MAEHWLRHASAKHLTVMNGKLRSEDNNEKASEKDYVGLVRINCTAKGRLCT